MSLSKHVELTRRISDGPINNDNAGAYVRTGPDADGRAIAPAVIILISYAPILLVLLPPRSTPTTGDRRQTSSSDRRSYCLLGTTRFIFASCVRAVNNVITAQE